MHPLASQHWVLTGRYRQVNNPSGPATTPRKAEREDMDGRQEVGKSAPETSTILFIFLWTVSRFTTSSTAKVQVQVQTYKHKYKLMTHTSVNDAFIECVYRIRKTMTHTYVRKWSVNGALTDDDQSFSSAPHQEPVLWIVAGYANLPQLFWLAI